MSYWTYKLSNGELENLEFSEKMEAFNFYQNNLNPFQRGDYGRHDIELVEFSIDENGETHIISVEPMEAYA